MIYVESHEPAGHSALLRWFVCGIIVLMMHASILLAIASQDDPNLETGASVVMMELAPISAAPPAPISELAPGPQQGDFNQTEQVKQEPPNDHSVAEPVPDLPRESDPSVALESEARAVREQTPKTQELPEAETKEELHQEAAVATATPSADVLDVRPAAPAPRLVERPTPAVVTWQRSMVMQLEHHKRYPPQARGEQGVATLAFTIDRQGHLLSGRIVRSAGSAILDAAALAMLSRAAPFPTPPPGIADELLSITVPIRYSGSAQR
jgi:protein TonB